MDQTYLVEPLSSQLGIEQYAARLGPPFNAFIEVVWAVNSLTYYRRETILPSCGINLMVNFGSTQKVLAYGQTAVNEEHEHYWVSGLQNQTLTIESSAESNLLSICFKPGGAHALFNLPIEEITNQVIDLDLLLGNRIEALRSQLGTVTTFTARLAIVRAWLQKQINADEYEYRLVYNALSTLYMSQGKLRISDICEQIGLSNKHMWALFKRLVGLPPKSIARLMRFQKVVESLRFKHDVNWAAVANQFNYYDQSHLIHEFQRFAGVTPGEYMARRTPEGTSLHSN